MMLVEEEEKKQDGGAHFMPYQHMEDGDSDDKIGMSLSGADLVNDPPPPAAAASAVSPPKQRISVPPGRLGILFSKTPPVVTHVSDDSPLASQVSVGQIIEGVVVPGKAGLINPSSGKLSKYLKEHREAKERILIVQRHHREQPKPQKRRLSFEGDSGAVTPAAGAVVVGDEKAKQGERGDDDVGGGGDIVVAPGWVGGGDDRASSPRDVKFDDVVDEVVANKDDDGNDDDDDDDERSRTTEEQSITLCPYSNGGSSAMPSKQGGSVVVGRWREGEDDDEKSITLAADDGRNDESSEVSITLGDGDDGDEEEEEQQQQQQQPPTVDPLDRSNHTHRVANLPQPSRGSAASNTPMSPKLTHRRLIECPYQDGKVSGRVEPKPQSQPDLQPPSSPTSPRRKLSEKDQVASCPYFSGAAERNAALFRSSRAGKRNSSIKITLNDTDNLKADLAKLDEITDMHASLGSLDFDMEYSYTAPSDDFKPNLTEEDLFDKPSTDGYFTRDEGVLIPDYQRKLDGLRLSRGRIWYTVGRRMQGLVACNGLIKVIDEMDIIEGDERACPDESLQIASSILGCLTYGYRSACWRNNINYEPAPALQIPWQMISERLGRRDVYFAVEDFIYNFKPLSGNSFVFDNIDQLTAMSGSGAEDLMGKLFCESNAYLKNMLPSILALCRGEWDSAHICHMIHEVKELNRMMGKAVPDASAGEKSIDPVEFATAFANYTAPLKDNVPALSGGGLLVFVVLDHIVGRKKFDSAMGIDVLTNLDWMPINWKRFVEYLRQRQLFNHVPKDLQYLWILLKDVYLGERGWLGRHKYRAYQFVELSGALGRASNKGSVAGAGALNLLEEARLERDPAFIDDRGSYKTCMFKGKIKSVNRVSEDRLTQLVTIESYKPLNLRVGDHIAVVMKNHDNVLWRFSVQHSLDLRTKMSIKDGSLTPEWKERLDFDKLDYNVYNVLLCAKLPKSTDKELHAGNLCQILNPEEPRLYSFATIDKSEGKKQIVTSFDLLVTNTGTGGCSDFLFASVGEELSFGISMAAKFHIPNDITRPLVVIAAGSGLGTYLPLIVNTDLPNPKYAFLAFRTESTVPLLDKYLEEEVNYGRLHLYVELSREDHTLVTNDREITRKSTKRRYINALMLEQRELLRELAAPLDEGGSEAFFYVCGNSDFFKTVREAMDSIDQGLVSRLVQSNRLHLEVQARGGVKGTSRTKAIRLSEMCFHNKMDDYWIVIEGKVYNFTDYLPWHPGGKKILHYVAGTDATVQWDLVKHNRDRMIFSQIPPFQLGPFDPNDPLGLNDLLDSITRTENCVNLYGEKGDMFEKLYDGYCKVQSVAERVFGQEFLELLFRLCQRDGNVRSRVLRRIWHVKNGRTRDLADNMYKIAPMKGKRKDKNPDHQGQGHGAVLRPAGLEERSRLHGRLVEACDLFFLRCKKAVANFEEVAENCSSDDSGAFCGKMFYRMTMAFESFYATLSQPLPLDGVRKWDVLRVETIARKTFSMRFNSKDLEIPKDFVRLCSQTPPDHDSSDFQEFLDQSMSFLDAKKSLEDLADTGLQTDIVSDWFGYDQARKLFNDADSDSDGLVAQRDIADLDLEHRDDYDINLVARFLNKKEGLRATYTFLDFLEAVEPEVARKRGLRRFSSAFKRGQSKSSLQICKV